MGTEIISFPIREANFGKNEKVKILNIFDAYDRNCVHTSFYFGDDWEEDVRRLKFEFSDNDYLFIISDGINV